jgi:nucleotide-binding universal stress UspA family protein
MTSTIFVPLDGSELAETALAPASRLAHDLDAALVCVTSTFTQATNAEEAYLARGVARAGTRRARSELLRGHFAPESIVDVASCTPDSMICMSTHGRGAITTMLLGSVAGEVVAHSEVPVVLVGPSFDASAGEKENVLVCLSGHREPARTVGVGAGLARDLEARLHVATVAEPGHEKEHGTENLADRLGAALRACGLDAAEHELVDADPTAAILELAERFDPRLLVIGRYVHEDHFYGRPVGRVAGELIRRSRWPVAVVPAAAVGSHACVMEPVAHAEATP